MKIKYTCSVCGEEFDKRKDCAAHEKLCSRLAVANAREQKLMVLSMRRCSGDCCANCRHFRHWDRPNGPDGGCTNSVVVYGMLPFGLPKYNAASICNYFERSEETE